MFNTMNTIRPRPYPQRETGNYNAGNEGLDKDGHNENARDQQQQQHREVVARGRAEDVQAQAPARRAIYSPANNAYPQGQPYGSRAATPVMYNPHQINPMQYQAAQAGYQPIEEHPAPAAPKPARSNKVNIAQILKDFRNTIKAIKVVQNWLDALFLQRINYSYNEEEVNPNFLVKFPDRNEKEPQKQQPEQQVEQQPEQNIEQLSEKSEFPKQDIIEIEPEELTLEEEFQQARQTISKKPNITIVPQDTKLKSLFVEAKKQAFSNNPQKAMQMFKEAFIRAEELKDNETQSRICLEIGKIYDDNDHFVQALNSYNKSLQYTTDVNVKSRAHYSMAQIYDDINEIEPALNHYLTSVSYAGKSDDLIGQSDSLTKMANIFTDKYDLNAFEYYDVARKLIEQTTDNSMKGYVLSNTADACVQFKKNDKALKYYAEAVRNYEKSNSTEEIALNYKSAAQIMIDFNSPNKAKSLLKKALVNAVKTHNDDLISEINAMLASVE